jgi:hypothetical protein
MTQTAQPKKRDLPVWLGITLIVIGVAAAGWFVWSQFSGFWTGPKGVFTIQGVDPGQAQFRPMPGVRQVRPQPSVREISKTEWRVRNLANSMTVTKGTDGKLAIGMMVSSLKVLPDDASWVLISRSKLTPASAKDIGLTPAQMKQFKDLPTQMGHRLPLTDAQTEQLRATFQKWLDCDPAQRDQVDREVAAKVGEVGQAAAPSLVKKLQDQYASCKSAITPEQWAKLKALSTAPPSTQP